MTSRLKRSPRRKRATYPDLATVGRGQACDITRQSCGVNRGLPAQDPLTLKMVPGRVTRGSFVFERELPRHGRSKYDPQACDAARGRRQ